MIHIWYHCYHYNHCCHCHHGCHWSLLSLLALLALLALSSTALSFLLGVSFWPSALFWLSASVNIVLAGQNDHPSQDWTAFRSVLNVSRCLKHTPICQQTLVTMSTYHYVSFVSKATSHCQFGSSHLPISFTWGYLGILNPSTWTTTSLTSSAGSGTSSAASCFVPHKDPTTTKTHPTSDIRINPSEFVSSDSRNLAKRAFVGHSLL